MTDLFYQVKLDNRDRVYQVTIHGEEGGRRVTIGKGNKRDIALGKSALSAASAYFKFRTWDTPDCAVGIHISKELRNNTSLQHIIGYVHYDYTGDKYPLVEKSDFPLGWAPLVTRLGHVHVGSYDDRQHEVNAANKHDMIDAYLQGYEVVIACLPYHKNVTHFLKIWTELDDIKAEAISRTAIKFALQSNRVIGGAIRNAKAVQAGERTAPDRNVALNMRVYRQAKAVDMSLIPRGVYPVYDPHGNAHSMRQLSWDPDVTFRQDIWINLAIANWQIELAQE